MVADMNVTGALPSQTTQTTDNAKQKQEVDANTPSFSEALAKKEKKNSAGKEEEIQDSKDSKTLKKDEKNTKEDSKDTKKTDTQDTAQPNPLTTKPNKKEAKSGLKDALQEEALQEEELQKKDKKTGISTESDINEEEMAEALATEETQDKSTKQNTKTLDNAQAKQDDKTKSADKKEVAQNKLDSNAQSTQAALTEEIDIQDEDIAQSAESKAKVGDKKQDSESIKSLNDVKKEAQARNLNLQKIEIIEQGKKTPINPQDLMDRDMLVENKERLALSLQDKGKALSASLAKTSVDSSENAKKEALLAELLNRYDANANAQRKAQNQMEKIQFKVGDGDKSMIIERTHIQPKNITESKFRNEIMEQEFLEELHTITGDEDLGELIETNRAKITAHAAQLAAKAGNGKESFNLPKTYQGWAQQGQFLDPKEIKDSNSVNGLFEMDVQKPFDALFAEGLKTDSKTKEAEMLIKTEKKIDDVPKEKVDSKQEVGAVHTKQEVSMKNAMAREAMKNFASQFREEVLNYKPPITRINLELNPANLGQVAMTISKKGKDLQVSITSNANVMTMFVQNAQELRQNLMQIGFNNLDLNFNTHDGQGSSNQQNDSQNQKDSNIKLQSIEEAEAGVELGNIPQSLEISLPQYA